MKHYFCCRSLGREEKVKRNVQSAFGVISALAPYLVESYSNRSWHGLLLYGDRFWALVEGNTITLASSMIGRRMGQARGSKEGIQGRVQGNQMKALSDYCCAKGLGLCASFCFKAEQPRDILPFAASSLKSSFQ